MTKTVKKYARDKAGFSFAELMVVIALVSVLSAVALPGFLSALPEKRLKSAARNVYSNLQRARLTAIKENRKIKVEVDSKGILITPVEPFTDINGNKSYDASVPEPFVDVDKDGVFDTTEPFTDVNGNGSRDVSVAEPYIDQDKNGVYTLTRYLLTLSEYSGVSYGSGSAGDGDGGGSCDWNSAACTQATAITFENTGTADDGSIYLQNDNDDVSYAATVTRFGAVKLRRFNGQVWE